MDFKDIKRMPRAYYSVDVDWEYMVEWIALERHEPYGIELEPDFQRHHVWNEEQQTKYVEWILKGGFSGRDIFWNCKGWQDSYEGPLQLVDGLQRITAVRKFLDDKLSVFGHTKSQFSGRIPRMECRFKFHINNLETEEEVLKWYLAMNCGGTDHTEEELNKVRKMLCENN